MIPNLYIARHWHTEREAAASKQKPRQRHTNAVQRTTRPFAAMAVGEHADLESTFYLLRRQPSIMDSDLRSEYDSSSNRRRKKRKVDK